MKHWIPACAGMTAVLIPACAGTTAMLSIDVQDSANHRSHPATSHPDIPHERKAQRRAMR